MHPVITYLLIMNAAGFLFMHMDKRRAMRGQYRIPERVLLAIAFLGGSAGSLAGMYTARHKTRKPKFSVGIPLMLAMQGCFALFWLTRGLN